MKKEDVRGPQSIKKLKNIELNLVLCIFRCQVPEASETRPSNRKASGKKPYSLRSSRREVAKSRTHDENGIDSYFLTLYIIVSVRHFKSSSLKVSKFAIKPHYLTHYKHCRFHVLCSFIKFSLSLLLVHLVPDKV